MAVLQSLVSPWKRKGKKSRKKKKLLHYGVFEFGHPPMWNCLFSVPFLYPIPVVVVSPTGVKRVVGGTDERKPKYVQ